MHENMEPHLHLQDIQVQNIVYRHRKEWMITQEAYARTNRFNSESLPFLRGNLTLYVKKGILMLSIKYGYGVLSINWGNSD